MASWVIRDSKAQLAQLVQLGGQAQQGLQAQKAPTVQPARQALKVLTALTALTEPTAAGGGLTAAAISGLAAGDIHSNVEIPGVVTGLLRKFSVFNFIAIMRVQRGAWATDQPHAVSWYCWSSACGQRGWRRLRAGSARRRWV